MAYGAILKFRFEEVLTFLRIFTDDSEWVTFEGWCVAANVNPLTEPSRRMISLMFYYIEKDLDQEQRDDFRKRLSEISRPRRLKLVKSDDKADTPDKPGVVPNKRWKAPPGWTPPGWNDEKSYMAAKQFMAFQRDPK